MLTNLKVFILKYYLKIKKNQNTEILTPKENELECGFIKIKLFK
jgi:hypothetical protein